MSRWKSTYDGQQISQGAQNTLKAVDAIKLEATSEPELAEYTRLQKLCRIIATRVSKVDPELLVLNSWKDLPTYFDQACNEVNAYNVNKNIGHLQNANNIVDCIVAILRPLDTGSVVEEFKSIADANAVFQQKIVVELERVRTRSEEIVKQLDSLSEAINHSRARLDENNQIIQQQKARLDQSIADFQKQFSDAQEKRTNDFADTLKRNSDEISAQTKQFDSKFSDDVARRKQEYESFFNAARLENDHHLNFLQKRQEEVDKIFGAIGTTAFAGNFKATADNEAKSANLWRWIALALMAAMIAVGGYAFYYSIGHETDWKVFAFRLGTVVVLAVPAVYAANESSRHRERERLNRKVHLELASIDAYLVLLPEAQRNTIKGGLTEKFFGVPVLKEKADEVTQKDLFGVLTTVLNNLTKGK